MFVLGAFALGVIGLFSFGGVNFFSKPQRFVVYFNETIHGLDHGSPVKLRGVRIGRVVGMNVRATPGASGTSEGRSLVAVVCELSRDVLADGEGRPVDVSDREELQRMVDKGLRARLGVIGLATGLLYVELDFLDPREFPVRVRPGVESPYLELPAAPSAISEFQANLTEVLNDLKRVDFEAIGREVEGLLADARGQINGADLARLSREWAEAGRAVRELAGSEETRRVLAASASAAERLDRVMAQVETAIGPGPGELTALLGEAREAITEFSATTTVVKRFVHAQQNLGNDASRAFARLGEAMAAVARLADFLERNPNALLSGRATETR